MHGRNGAVSTRTPRFHHSNTNAMPGLNVNWHIGGLPLYPPTPNGDSKSRTLSWNNHTAPASVNGWILPNEESEEEMESLKVNGSEKLTNGHRNTTRPALERKPSSPMMPAFMTSAPGKVIVYGEHAVVYGKAAMAAAISLRSYLLVTALSRWHRTITLRFPDIGMEHSWKLDDLPWSIFSQPSKKKHYYDLVDKLDPELVEAMQPHLTIISPKASSEDRKIHQNAASAFLYRFEYRLYHSWLGFSQSSDLGNLRRC